LRFRCGSACSGRSRSGFGWLALALALALALTLALALGSAIHILLIRTSLLRLVAKLPILPFFRGVIDALVVAFSTASSSATLPVAMRVT